MDTEMSEEDEWAAFITKLNGMSPRERQACYDELLADCAKQNVELAIAQDHRAALQTKLDNVFAKSAHIKKVEVGLNGEYEFTFYETEIVAMQEIQDAAVLDKTVIVRLRNALQNRINTAYKTYHGQCYTVHESGRKIQKDNEILKKLGRAVSVAKERMDKLVVDGERKPLL